MRADGHIHRIDSDVADDPTGERHVSYMGAIIVTIVSECPWAHIRYTVDRRAPVYEGALSFLGSTTDCVTPTVN